MTEGAGPGLTGKDLRSELLMNHSVPLLLFSSLQSEARPRGAGGQGGAELRREEDLHGRGAVYPCDLLLEDPAEIHTPAFQRGRQETVGHAEHLRVQVQSLHLEETEGQRDRQGEGGRETWGERDRPEGDVTRREGPDGQTNGYEERGRHNRGSDTKREGQRNIKRTSPWLKYGVLAAFK